MVIKPALRIKGEIFLPGDKSIAHRLIIASSLSRGKITIDNFPANKDCLYTIRAFKKLGIKISRQVNKQKNAIKITVFGKGLRGLKRPQGAIFVGDSGTTLRLLLGVLAGQDFLVKLTAGKSLSQRPMLRVIQPLRIMGAQINTVGNARHATAEEYPPIMIKGGNLNPITYKMPVASAQVKSAILLAGLYSKGKTRVVEQIKTRDHTERMLRLFKIDVKSSKKTIVLKGGGKLVSPKEIYIPGDISSASFFIVLAAILPQSAIVVRNVSLNPLRIGIVNVLKRMGANIQVKCHCPCSADTEPCGDIKIINSRLTGTVVRKDEVPSLIDELPVLMVAASLADGKTIFEGIQELRVKETDRIKSIYENLVAMGAIINISKDAVSEKMIIQGVNELQGRHLKSYGDHRTAMSMIVAALAAKGKSSIDDTVCINKSFPGFLNLLNSFIIRQDLI